jgi:hypothetical protein
VRTRPVRPVQEQPVSDRTSPMTKGDPQPVSVKIDAARGADDGFAAFERFARSVGSELLHAVECTLAEESIDPAHMTALHVEVADHLLATHVAAGSDAEDDPLPLYLLTAVGLLVTWLTLARDDEADPKILTCAVAWVHTNFGVRPADAVAVAGAFLGDGRDAWVAARQLFGRRDDDLLPALIWLAAAVVEQYGDGDVSWLPHGHHVP